MQKLLESVQHDWPMAHWQGTTVVVAVSGGPDSVALLDAMQRLIANAAPLTANATQSLPSETQLVVAHFNHAQRGLESDADMEWVERLASSYALPCICSSLAPPVGTTAGGGVGEAFLRQARHRFLKTIASQMGAAWIATGHTSDDVVETMLHHLLRGTGPAGLASIAPIRRINRHTQLVHPLLGVSKTMVLEYLAQHGIEYRIDPSNASDRYTRNRIRHQLLPYLRDFAGSPRLDERLRITSRWIREEHAVIEQLASEWLTAASIEHGEDHFELSLEQARAIAWPVIREALVQRWHAQAWPLREMGAKHWERLRNLIERGRTSPHPNRLQLPGGIEAVIRKGKLKFLAKPQSHTAPSDTLP
jgi:tRNA(Ile)-lysidine synthase